jgi:hypothetical protein
LCLQAIAASDAGEPGSDDDDIEVLGGHGGSKSVSSFKFQGRLRISNPLRRGNCGPPVDDALR